MKTIIRYRPYLKALARNLRNNSTPGEIVLWQRLKSKKLLGYDFHRQKPIDRFIVDFFCRDLMLAIEIDGSSHDDKAEYDAQRQAILEEIGINVLRFSEHEAREHTISVVITIEEYIKNLESSSLEYTRAA